MLKPSLLAPKVYMSRRLEQAPIRAIGILTKIFIAKLNVHFMF